MPFWEDITAFAAGSLIESPAFFSPYIWPPDDATLGDRSLATRAEALPFRKRWNTLWLSKALGAAFTLGSGQQIGVSQWRHLNKAITRKYLRNISLSEGATTTSKLTSSGDFEDSGSSSEESDSEDEKEGGNAVVWNAQAGHSGRTSRNIYGRLLGEGAFESGEARATFRSISLLWHEFLGFGARDLPSTAPPHTTASPSSSGKDSRGRKRRSSTVYNLSQFDRSREARLETLRGTDLLAALRQFYGPTAAFRGRQEEALRAIIEGRNPIVVVRPTGSGKSFCFLLPAYVSSGVSLVIVPLVSLQDDLYRRATELGIPSVIWKSTDVYTAARLVFTTPEAFFTPAFT